MTGVEFALLVVGVAIGIMLERVIYRSIRSAIVRRYKNRHEIRH